MNFRGAFEGRFKVNIPVNPAPLRPDGLLSRRPEGRETAWFRARRRREAAHFFLL